MPKQTHPLMKNLRTILLFVVFFLVASVPGSAALNIQFDYSYDTGNFFSGANFGRRALLDAAANIFESRLTLETFGAITPSGTNTWSLDFQNPSTGATVTLNNPVIAANTITIYVGARDLPDSTLGLSGFGFDAFGDSSWTDLFNARNSTTNFDSFGGFISFDSLASWYSDTNPQTLESFPGQYDLFSVAQHEIEHLLGFTVGARAFAANISGTNFIGANVSALNGGPAPLAAGNDLSHWQQGLTSGGFEVLMDPAISTNQRKNATELDFAALKDIGYNVEPVPEPTVSALLTLSAVALTLARWRRS
jgi:hypothetical protein